MARMPNDPLTLGVEEEFQILDPDSLALAPGLDALRAAGSAVDLDVKSEIHACCAEVVTAPCPSIDALADAVRANRRRILEVAKRAGYRVALAGTHPFSLWSDLPTVRGGGRSQSEYYFQEAHRHCLAFALHVHVAIPDRATGLRVMNEARELLPVLYALSCSSPFLESRRTGLKSSRLLRAFGFPRTGIPDAFERLADYDGFIQTLSTNDFIIGPGQLWWDIRLHHTHPTVEFRVCDAIPRVDDVLAIAALCQTYVAYLLEQYERGAEMPARSRLLLEENRWRAARFGAQAALFDFKTESVVLLRDIVRDARETLAPFAERLGTQRHLDKVSDIANAGDAADRQITVWNGGAADWADVVRCYADETADV